MNRWNALVLAGILTAGATAQAQVKLEPKQIENAKYTLTSATKTHQIITLNGIDIETGGEESSTSSITTGSKRADGSIANNRKIESLKAKVDLPMGLGFSFDSANPEADKPSNPEIAKIHAALKGIANFSYTTIQDKAGKVVSIEGIDKSIDQLKDLDDTAKKQLKARFNEDKIKQAHEQDLAFFPDQEVKKGDTWNRTEVMDLGSGQSLTFKKKYEYAGTEDVNGKTLDKINVTANEVTLTVDAEPNTPVKVAESRLNVDFSEGTLLFDRAEGRRVSQKSKTRIKGDITLEAGGNMIPGLIDLTIELEVKVDPTK